ncbi:MAG TPA: amino acid adenylation domain-containing protein [Blastocatellia bacterium]|jgi:amino acid adenylation domain-containing protein|nr:amino acid adenylation domain-containing protein [Blastocatellia bacterium]
MSNTKPEIVFFDRKLIEERDYWVDKLAGFSESETLRFDHQRGGQFNGRNDAIDLNLSAELCGKLMKLTNNGPFLLYTTLMSALKICLHRYTGRESIAVGSPARRQGGESGEFVNALAIVDHLDDRLSFKDFLLKQRETLLAAYSRQRYPFRLLRADLKLPEAGNGCPLFDVALTLSDIHHRMYEAEHNIHMAFDRDGDRVTGRVEFNGDAFEPGTITGFTGHFLNLLEAAVQNPGERVGNIPMLTEEERHRVLVEWNDTREPIPTGLCAHQLFEAQAERTPDATALEFGNQTVTYRELNEKANRLAHHLIKSGAGPETVVALSLDRSIDLIVALMAILKSGAAYLPLDPSYPLPRLEFMLADSQASMALTQPDFLPLFSGKVSEVICPQEIQSLLSVESERNPEVEMSEQNLAYVLYTSGSTGRPKGVMVPHRGLCNLAGWMEATNPLSASDRVLQKTPMSFDASVWEVIAPLTAGAQLVIAEPGGHQDSSYLVRTIKKEGITIFQGVPSMLKAMLEDPAFKECTSLRQIYSGGEALLPHLRDGLLAHGQVELVNVYGPTEASVDSTSYVFSSGDIGSGGKQSSVPIGRPVSNAVAYVLGHCLEPVPVGVEGELYIGGAGLARGYRGRPDLTAEKFIPDSFGGEEGARLYRTGDLVRYDRDGNLEFVGRIDQQVKIRGYGIELGEIEGVLNEAGGIKEAVVIAREDDRGENYLAAYIVREESGMMSQGELRGYVKERLPEYMVPKAFVMMEKMPLLSNGKLDRRALPEPEAARPELEPGYVAPHTAMEEVLAELWRDVLGIQKVGVNTNFFSLGGHSLLATQLITRVRDTFQVELPLKKFFENPTITGLAATVAESQAEKADESEMAQLLVQLERLSDAEAELLLAGHAPVPGQSELANNIGAAGESEDSALSANRNRPRYKANT